MEQNKVREFYKEVFGLILELFYVHYDNNTPPPKYYYNEYTYKKKLDVVTQLIEDMEFYQNGVRGKPCGPILDLVAYLADAIEVTIDAGAQEYEVDAEDIREILMDTVDFSEEDDPNEALDEIVYKIKSNDEHYAFAYEEIKDNHEQAKAGARKVAAKLRELVRSIRQ